MVIEDITKAVSVVKIRKTIDFLDEKIEISSDLKKALEAQIPVKDCLILNLEENSFCCLSHSKKLMGMNVTTEKMMSERDIGCTVRCLTYQDIKDEYPEVLFILGGDGRTARRFYGEPFLGARVTYIYHRKPPFADLLSKSMLIRYREETPAEADEASQTRL